VATDTQRTLIGVQQGSDGELRIWGLVSSGTRWLRDVQGGRRAGAPLPPVPVVHVDGPGSLAVYRGAELVANLRSGRVSGSRADLFASKWLPARFADFREALLTRHAHAQANSGRSWAQIEDDLSREISERMMKRVIALLRAGRHGGTIVFVPADSAEDLGSGDAHINLKYRFANPPTQRSFPDLVAGILNRLAELHGASGATHAIGWHEFETTADEELVTLDEALFETAYLIAGLASADGAVVLSKQHYILGFGGMISGRLPAIRRVTRALDVEANGVADEATENVGARHRSAYRLVSAMTGAIAIVVSQDGGVRFVANKDGRVTYWEQE
jgi:hypothetical protein